jgi:hypothetical protein
LQSLLTDLGSARCSVVGSPGYASRGAALSPPQRADGLRFHDLRHTYAALMVAADAHPKYLQAQMGTRRSASHQTSTATCFPDANRGVLESLDALTAPSTPHHANAPKTTPKGKSLLPGTLKTGATGLEPATSGVTDRYKLNRHSRL